MFFFIVTRNSIASYYVTMTIGCPLSQKIKVQNVTYGSKAKNCFTDFNVAIKIVQDACPGTSCIVKATDTFFKKNPCKSYSWKMLNISYTCVDSKFFFVVFFLFEYQICLSSQFFSEVIRFKIICFFLILLFPFFVSLAETIVVRFQTINCTCFHRFSIYIYKTAL